MLKMNYIAMVGYETLLIVFLQINGILIKKVNTRYLKLLFIINDKNNIFLIKKN